MKILFLGLLYNRDEEIQLLDNSKCGLQGAANAYQWNLIDGMDEIAHCPVDILNSLPVGSYPKYYNKLILRTRKWCHKEGAADKELGTLNFPLLKQMIRSYAFYKEVKVWCEKNKDDDIFILSYSLYLPYLKVLAKIKKKYKWVKTCVIVPDLPNAFGLDPGLNPLMKLYFKKTEKDIYKLAKDADSYCLLTKDMIDPLNIINKPYVIVEGIAKTLPRQEMIARTKTIILLYAGTLHKRFGLDKLVEAFLAISADNYQLWFCGSGDYENEIINTARKDVRIKFHGYVTANQVLELLEQATVLINPRSNEGEYTRYSFPSKTMEYMSLGRPILMFKLDGIPDEYDDYLYYIKDNSVEGIKKGIIEICSKSIEELETRSKKIYEFVQKEKSGSKQAGKLLAMLETMKDHKLDRNLERSISSNKLKTAKKVLQINITCGYGSTGRLTQELHYYLQDKGYSSYIAYSAYESDLKESFKIENTFENHLRRVLNRYIGRKYGHSSLGTGRLIRRIKKLKPDLIHLHNIHQNSLDFPRLFKFLKEYKAPIIYTLHDCWAFTGGCYHFTNLNCDGYQYGCQPHCKMDRKNWDVANKKPAAVLEEKKKALFALDRLQIVCVSKWLKDSAEDSYMKELYPQVIYNGIDTDIFKPVKNNLRDKLGIKEDEFIILGVANHWSKEKGLDIFFQLAEVLKAPYKILLVGLIKETCPSNILTIPRTDYRHTLARIYSTGDLFLNASKEEAFGLTAVEAMACGTPVVAYPTTACKEVVGINTGIVLNSFELSELLEAIKEISIRGKAFYSSHCIEHVNQFFTKEEMLKKYLNLYENFINKRI